MYLNGRVGQVIGPFNIGEDLLAEGGTISNFTKETSKPVLLKLGIQAPKGTVICINNVPVKVGFTGIYELDETVYIRSLSFPNGADENVIIDFVY